jgi:hypothetical protein
MTFLMTTTTIIITFLGFQLNQLTYDINVTSRTDHFLILFQHFTLVSAKWVHVLPARNNDVLASNKN